jgi:hypothetical protein
MIYRSTAINFLARSHGSSSTALHHLKLFGLHLTSSLSALGPLAFPSFSIPLKDLETVNPGAGRFSLLSTPYTRLDITYQDDHARQ